MYSNYLKLLLIIMFSPALVFAGGQASGGSDRIEVLFFRAHNVANSALNRISNSNIRDQKISDASKNWLLRQRVDGRTNLEELQLIAKNMKLKFIEPPCYEGKFKRGSTFDGSDPLNPIMIVSRSENKLTTLADAAAMSIHEAGHLTGEMNHLFLSQLGVELVGSVNKVTQDDLSVIEMDVKFEDGDSRFWESLCTTDTEIDKVYPGGGSGSNEKLFAQQRLMNSLKRKSVLENLTNRVLALCRDKDVSCSDISFYSYISYYRSGAYCHFSAYPGQFGARE